MSRSIVLPAALVLASHLLVRPAGAEPVPVEDCVRAALDRAPLVRAAVAQSEAARAAIELGRAAYLPTVSGHTEYGKAKGYDEAVTNGGSTQAVVRVETKLADGGVRGAELAAARSRFGSAAAAERQQRADIAFAVRGAYFNALAARAESALGATTIATLREYVTLLERQEGLSAVPENDVIRARLAVATEETHRRQVDTELAASRRELESLAGTPIDPSSLVVPLVVPIAEAEATTDPVAAVESSATVATARAALEAGEEDARAIRAEAWGNVVLSADAGAIDVRPQDTFSRNGGAQFLLGYTVPLFDGARSSRLSAALAEVSAARAKLDEARRGTALTLERLHAEEVRARAEAAASRAALPLAEKNFQLLRARHLGGGSVRLLDVLDGLTQLSEMRRSIARAELEDRLAAAGRARALGVVGP